MDSNYFYVRNIRNAEVIRDLGRNLMVWQSEAEARAFITRLPAGNSQWQVIKCPLEMRPDQVDK